MKLVKGTMQLTILKALEVSIFCGEFEQELKDGIGDGGQELQVGGGYETFVITVAGLTVTQHTAQGAWMGNNDGMFTVYMRNGVLNHHQLDCLSKKRCPSWQQRNIKSLYHWPFVRENHQWPVYSPHKYTQSGRHDGNGNSRLGGDYWDYCPGALSWSQVSATHLKLNIKRVVVAWRGWEGNKTAVPMKATRLCVQSNCHNDKQIVIFCFIC